MLICSYAYLYNLILQTHQKRIRKITMIGMQIIPEQIVSTKYSVFPLVNMQKKTKKVEQVEIMRFISNQCLIRLSGIGTEVTRQGKNEF